MLSLLFFFGFVFWDLAFRGPWRSTLKVGLLAGFTHEIAWTVTWAITRGDWIGLGGPLVISFAIIRWWKKGRMTYLGFIALFAPFYAWWGIIGFHTSLSALAKPTAFFLDPLTNMIELFGWALPLIAFATLLALGLIIRAKSKDANQQAVQQVEGFVADSEQPQDVWTMMDARLRDEILTRQRENAESQKTAKSFAASNTSNIVNATAHEIPNHFAVRFLT